MAAATLAATCGLVMATERAEAGAFPGANGKIAFVTYDGTDSEIATMNPDGSGQTLLTDNSPAGGGIDAADQRPAFSPDGERIVFLSNRDQPDREVFVMDADGENEIQLTYNAVDDNYPSFSPDGQRILFTSEIGGTGEEIFVMGADGQNPTNLTNSPTEDSEPDWQPLNMPACDVSGEPKQKSAKRVSVTVTCSEDASVTASGTLAAPKATKHGASDSKAKQVALGPVTVEVQPGAPTPLSLEPSKKGRKLLKKAQKAGKKPKGSISISAVDDLGAQTADSFAVRLKPKKK